MSSTRVETPPRDGGGSDTVVVPMSDEKQKTEEAEPEKDAKKDNGSMKHLFRVFKYNDRLGGFMNVIAFLCMAISGTALPLMDVVFGKFINVFNDFVTGKLSPAGYREEVGNYSLYFIYLFVGKFVLVYVGTMLSCITGIRATKELRIHFVRQVLRQEISFFDSPSSSISGQITTNGNLVNNGISEKLALTVQACASFFAAFVVAFAVHWKLTLIIFAIVPVNLIVTIVCVVFDTIYENQMFNIYSRSSSLAEEAFSSIRTAHAFWAFPRLVRRFNFILEEASKVGAKKSLIYAILFPTEFFCIFAGYGLAFWQGIRMYASGEISNPGTVVTVIFAVLVAAQALTQIAPQSIAISKATAAAQELFETIDREPDIDSLSAEGSTIQGFRGSIRLRHVQFAYPSRPDVSVLHGLDLDIPENKTTALVGASGSGKSTIFGLLERWYRPKQGSVITLDGTAIEELNLRWLRTNIRLVQQEPTLFSGTVAQNVENGLVGTEMASLADEEKKKLVHEACKAAYAHDFIQDLPEGYDTPIGERGASLSGGQKQRIVIARSIISNPKVLLLDEATSALDPSAERIVQQALNNVARGRTMVVIAHRLSTIRDADNIIVMSKGEVIEQGSHAQLIEQDGAYAKLVRAQDLGQDGGGRTGEGGGEQDADDDGEDLDRLMTQVSEAQSLGIPAAGDEEMYSLLKGLYLVVMEQRSLWFIFSILLVGCIVGGVTYPALAVLFAKTMEAFETIDTSKGNFFSLMFFIVAIGNFIAYFACGWLVNIVAQHVMKTYRGELFDNTLRQDMVFFDHPSHTTGALVARLSTEPTSLVELLSMNIILILVNVINLLTSSILAIAVGWKLGLVLVLGALPLLVGSGYLRIRLEFKFDDDTAARFAESSGLASEAAMAIRTVSSLALEEDIVRRYRERVHGLAKQAIGGLGWKMFFYSLSQSITFLAMALGFWYGGRLVSTAEYTTTQFYTVFVAIIFCGESAAMFFQYTTSITKARTAMNYIFRLRRDVALRDEQDPGSDDSEGDAVVEKYEGTHPSIKPRGASVNCDSIAFAYPLRPKLTVLRGIDVRVPPGSMVAFVGASGCGKSTMIALLERFYDPTSGAILIDDMDISTVPRRRHRKGVALVQQEPVLYQGSIRDNIALGVDTDSDNADGTSPADQDDTAIVEACKQANVWEFIASLPSGLSTACGTQGLSLSGGQRQRIAIARALLRNPRLLLLDEATSAVDSESERIVQVALDKAASEGGRTTVAVAHRLSTIRNANTIVVFERGRVVQMGTHDELLRKKGGVYHQMVLGQSLDREAGGTG